MVQEMQSSKNKSAFSKVPTAAHHNQSWLHLHPTSNGCTRVHQIRDLMVHTWQIAIWHFTLLM